MCIRDSRQRASRSDRISCDHGHRRALCLDLHNISADIPRSSDRRPTVGTGHRPSKRTRLPQRLAPASLTPHPARARRKCSGQQNIQEPSQRHPTAEWWCLASRACRHREPISGEPIHVPRTRCPTYRCGHGILGCLPRASTSCQYGLINSSRNRIQALRRYLRNGMSGVDSIDGYGSSGYPKI